jgi:hypothetical protein
VDVTVTATADVADKIISRWKQNLAALETADNPPESAPLLLDLKANDRLQSP